MAAAAVPHGRHALRLPLRISTVLFTLIAVQTVFGYTKILALHVPLGVALVFGVVRLAVYGWREADR